MHWIQHPVILEGEKVKLVPLSYEHFDALLAIGKDKRIWEFMTLKGDIGGNLLIHLKSTVLKRSTGEQYPFTIIDKVSHNIIGSTLMHSLAPENRKLEIGYTWYDPLYWGTGYNTECKLVLLTCCFEILKTVRVQFQANELNLRSRNAILKTGATFEGILRKERLNINGTARNTAMYSIIDDEWQAVKQGLERLTIRQPKEK